MFNHFIPESYFVRIRIHPIDTPIIADSCSEYLQITVCSNVNIIDQATCPRTDPDSSQGLTSAQPTVLPDEKLDTTLLKLFRVDIRVSE